MATLAPSAARRFAIAAPIPREPPVTTATLPANFCPLLLLIYFVLSLLCVELLPPSTGYNPINEAIPGSCPNIMASDCENDPAEGAAINQVTQSISRFGQWEGLSHDRFDRTGFKKWDNNVPSVSNGGLRLSEHVEPPDAGLWHNEIYHVNGCITACGIPQCCEASFQGKRSELLAQDFTTDSVDDNVCAVTARDTTHAVSQLLQGGIDDFIESERLRLLGFRMIGRA